MREIILAGIVIIGLVFILLKRDRQEIVQQQQSLKKAVSATPKQWFVDPAVFMYGLQGLQLNQDAFLSLKSALQKKIVGMDQFMHSLFVSLLVPSGHVLVEGVPWLAKTRTISTLADLLDLSFKRIQFTPDMLPSDVTGVEMFNSQKKAFEFVEWPLFAQMILADEINRTTPKVQSALLEAMEERQVTVGKATYPLPSPFFVLATQNPLEQEGTYPLPEAQVDRFVMKIVVSYPSREQEQEMLQVVEHDAVWSEHILDADKLLSFQQEVEGVIISEEVKGYIVRLVEATRHHATLQYGASPRASIALMKTAKAVAWLEGRNYVTHKDIQWVALAVLRHRVVLSYDIQAKGKEVDEVVGEILQGVTLT